MGLRTERKNILKYKKVYEKLKIIYGKQSFRISGNVESWSDIEIIVRAFYKNLEKLLYTKETFEYLYGETIKKVLDENGLGTISLFDAIKLKDFSFEALNSLLMKVFDFTYFAVRKKLPYTPSLSAISGALSELLENTFKYTGGDFSITAGLTESETPLVINLENNYESRDDEETKKNLENLERGIQEVNEYEDPEHAYLEVMKLRAQNPEEAEDGSPISRLGFAKIRADIKAKVYYLPESKFFGTSGITLRIFIPVELRKDEEVKELIDIALKNI